MSSRSLLFSLLDLRSFPLYFLLSLTFLLPLLIPLTVKESVLSVSQQNSSTLQMTFGCAAAITIPLFIDILLDFITTKEAPYLKQRFLSTLIFAVSNVVILSYLNTPHAEMVLLTSFLWSYFLEFSIIISSIQDLLRIKRSHYAVLRVFIGNGGIYAFFFGGLLNTTLVGDSPLTAYIAIIGLATSSLVLLSRLYSVLKTHYQVFRSSGMSFIEWYSNAQSSTKFVQLRVVGVCLQLLVLSITLFAIKPRFHNSRGIFFIDNILPVMIVRVVFFVFEYFVAARIFRSQIIRENHDLGFKTKLIKYFSHEMRSPLMVILVGIELIQQSIDKMKTSGSASPEWDETIEDNAADVHRSCKQSLEILDNLLLYERIESDSLAIELVRGPALQTVREALTTHSSAGRGAQVGISLHYLQDQFNDGSRMLAVNMPYLRHVLEPALSCASQGVERCPDGGLDVSSTAGESHEGRVTAAIVEGPMIRKIHFQLFVDSDFDLLQSVLKSQLSVRSSLNRSIAQRSHLPTWLHMQTTFNREEISDADIQAMHSRNLELVREG